MQGASGSFPAPNFKMSSFSPEIKQFFWQSAGAETVKIEKLGFFNTSTALVGNTEKTQRKNPYLVILQRRNTFHSLVSLTLWPTTAPNDTLLQGGKELPSPAKNENVNI